MAALTLATVLPEMHVVLRVAVGAGGIELYLIRRLLVTAGTDELRVRARQGEMSFLAVVEFPDTPAVRRMAARAVLAETAFVHVVRAMAGVTIPPGVLVGARDVALLARHGNMQSDEWKVRQVVIEACAGAPAFRCMALSAVVAQLAGVHVAGAMAAHAARFQVLGGNYGRMAGVAVHLLVPPLQRPLRVARVVERRRLPFFIAMARAAFVAKAGRVRVLAAVAPFAGARQRVFQLSGTMAVAAVNTRVDAFEREPGFPAVIEFGGLPPRRRVAVGTLRAALVPMDIIRCVARYALLGRVLVAIAEMAGETGNVLVLVFQSERGLVVIEADAAPGDGVVAVRAIAAEPALVRFLQPVTRVAICGGLTEAFALLVAAVAGNGSVRAVKREVGALVVELIRAELDGVGLAAEVLRMTGAALERSAAIQSSVKAALRGDIGCDFLVACEAELRLTSTIAAVMAGGALFFVFRVRGAQFARHEERFRIHGISPRGGE